MDNSITSLRPNESFEQYRTRIYKAKQSGLVKLTWVEIANLFAEKWGLARDESTWRKEAKEFLTTQVEEVTSKDEDNDEQ